MNTEPEPQVYEASRRDIKNDLRQAWIEEVGNDFTASGCCVLLLQSPLLVCNYETFHIRSWEVEGKNTLKNLD